MSLIRILSAVLFLALPFQACAATPSAEQAPPQFQGEWTQGAALVGETAPDAKVWFNGRSLRVSERGRFVFGLNRDETGPVKIRVVYADGRDLTYSYPVTKREYAVQKIDGLPEKMVTPPPEALEQIRLDIRRVTEARAGDTPRTDFAAGYIWPVTGRISGVYGSQRILNGVPKQPHFGVDIAAPAGTPVKATAGGIVRLARDDLYYTGGTIILDHGHGVSSTYLHLSKLLVKEGQDVRQGDVIGEVGATGRATGPHLCFRFNWFNTRLDAQLLAGPMPAGKETD